MKDREYTIDQQGEYAIYQGKEYTSGGMGHGKLVLRSTDIKDVDNGFEPCEPFKIKEEEKDIVCLKYVHHSEAESYYNVTTRAIYKGYDFRVLEERGDEISIVAMTGDYKVWLGLGMKIIDRGVYQKWIKKEEAEIRTVKEEKHLRHKD